MNKKVKIELSPNTYIRVLLYKNKSFNYFIKSENKYYHIVVNVERSDFKKIISLLSKSSENKHMLMKNIVYQLGGVINFMTHNIYDIDNLDT